MRNTKTGLALRAQVDATLTQVTLYLLKPQLRKLLLAVWADRCYFFFSLESDHHVPRFSVANTLKHLPFQRSAEVILPALALAASG